MKIRVRSFITYKEEEEGGRSRARTVSPWRKRKKLLEISTTIDGGARLPANYADFRTGKVDDEVIQTSANFGIQRASRR